MSMPLADTADLASVELPTPDEEIWRYSRIGELDPTAFRPGTAVRSITGPGEYVVTPGDTVELFEGDTPDVFAAVNRSHARTVHVVVPAGAVVDEPVVIVNRVPADGVVVCPRVAIEAGDDSEVTVIERFVSDGDGRSLVLPVVQVDAGPAARVSYLSVNEVSDQTWLIGHQQSRGDRDSSTLLATVALGGDYARTRSEARVVGRGGSTRQVALYFAGGDQMHDFRTIQDHSAPSGHSDLLFKGAVQDRARSVYTGLIHIGEDAKGTAAYQTNRNLTLSDGAWAESVPNLDIETNDVTCSHASTVGPIDDEQRFYLESRGVRPEVAERLVVLGFFDEVLAQLPASSIADELRASVAAKLNIGSSGSGT